MHILAKPEQNFMGERKGTFLVPGANDECLRKVANIFCNRKSVRQPVTTLPTNYSPVMRKKKIHTFVVLSQFCPQWQHFQFKECSYDYNTIYCILVLSCAVFKSISFPNALVFDFGFKMDIWGIQVMVFVLSAIIFTSAIAEQSQFPYFRRPPQGNYYFVIAWPTLCSTIICTQIFLLPILTQKDKERLQKLKSMECDRLKKMPV